MQYFGKIYAFVIILRQKSNTFWQTAFVKIPPLELVEKNLSGDDRSVTICRAASRKICPAYGMKPKRGNRGTPGCSRYLCKIVVCKVKVPLGAEPAEDGEEDISF